MTHPPLSAALGELSDNLTASARRGAEYCHGHGVTLAFQAARLVALAEGARKLEHALRAAEAANAGLRAALATARISNAYLAAELSDEADAHARLARTQRYDGIIRSMLPTPPGPLDAAP